jgi:hypothetical protein
MRQRAPRWSSGKGGGLQGVREDGAWSDPARAERGSMPAIGTAMLVLAGLVRPDRRPWPTIPGMPRIAASVRQLSTPSIRSLNGVHIGAI